MMMLSDRRSVEGTRTNPCNACQAPALILLALHRLAENPDFPPRRCITLGRRRINTPCPARTTTQNTARCQPGPPPQPLRLYGVGGIARTAWLMPTPNAQRKEDRRDQKLVRADQKYPGTCRPSCNFNPWPNFTAPHSRFQPVCIPACGAWLTESRTWRASRSRPQ